MRLRWPKASDRPRRPRPPRSPPARGFGGEPSHGVFDEQSKAKVRAMDVILFLVSWPLSLACRAWATSMAWHHTSIGQWQGAPQFSVWQFAFAIVVLSVAVPNPAKKDTTFLEDAAYHIVNAIVAVLFGALVWFLNN